MPSRPPTGTAPVATVGCLRPAPADIDSVTRRWLADEPDALRAAYDAWATPVHTFCVRRLGTTDGADATQQVFVEAWRTRDRFDPLRGTLPQWLFGIARNLCHNSVRHRARRPETVGNDHADTGATGADLERVTDRLLVQYALSRLPDRQRLVIEESYFTGRTNQEISEHHDIPLGTVKSDIRRGLALLRSEIGVRT